ncbi:MAG: GxxExxY protein [Verrucomicrobiae bacterium]|nr:GxxExxY protein [Verrucomicrobiae bacterium]
MTAESTLELAKAVVAQRVARLYFRWRRCVAWASPLQGLPKLHAFPAKKIRCNAKHRSFARASGDFIADLIVSNQIIIEVKSAREIHPAHVAQTLNYLRATQLRVGIIANFGPAKLETRRVVL